MKRLRVRFRPVVAATFQVATARRRGAPGAVPLVSPWRADARRYVLLACFLALVGCSRDSEPQPERAPALKELASVNPTPAFRNLGKRGESKL